MRKRFRNDIHVQPLCVGIPDFNTYNERVVRKGFKHEAYIHMFSRFTPYSFTDRIPLICIFTIFVILAIIVIFGIFLTFEKLLSLLSFSDLLYLPV